MQKFFLLLKFRALIGLIALCGLVATSNSSSAESQGPLDLYVMEPLDVYDKADEASAVIQQLDLGDEVPVASKEKNGFRRVRVNVGGVTRTAYVKSDAIQLSYIKSRNEIKRLQQGSDSYRKHNGLGVFFSYSRLNQGSRTFTTQDSTATYEIDEMVSTGFYPGLFIDHPSTDNLTLRFYLALRKNTFKGKANLGTSKANTEISQSLIGGGLTFKYYLTPNGKYWLGGGSEISRGTSVSVLIDGTPSEVPKEIQPVYWFFYATTGYEFDLKGWCYLLPELRAGLAVNTDPNVIDLEATLNVAWTL